jgi:hypothetical protein
MSKKVKDSKSITDDEMSTKPKRLKIEKKQNLKLGTFRFPKKIS